MARPSIEDLSSGSIRRRTRNYDVGGLAQKLVDIIDFLRSPYVVSVDAGDIKPTFARTAPDGWLMLDGSSFNASTYPDLAAAIGTTSLPDFRGRFPIGAGGVTGAQLGATGGAGEITLTQAQLPSHTHAVTDTGHTHAVTDPGHAHTVTDPGHAHASVVLDVGAGGGGATDGAAPGQTSTETTGIAVDAAQTGIGIGAAQSGLTVENTGDGDPIEVTPPYVGVNWMIKT